MGIDQPRWKVPEYSKRQINDAGDIIRDENATEQEYTEALKVVDNWRSAHAYPLHVFYINLEKANGLYDYLERNRGNKPFDIVMVRATSYSTVKAAYPNYFLDIGEFIELVEQYLK